MSSLFLMRPRRLPDESLSSWRQRVGWANGYRLFPLRSGALRRSDPDLGLHLEDLRWVAATHGSTSADVTAMTFRGHAGALVSDVESRKHPPWWLRSRYGSSERSHGAMFCPVCLATDKVPYFRLSWRLGFNTACEQHGVHFLDSCRRCGAAPWPAACGGIEHLCSGFETLDRCWRCADRLSAQAASTPRVSATPAAWLRRASLPAGLEHAPTTELLSALRAVCQLFVRTKTRRLLAATGAWQPLSDRCEQEPMGANAVEHLPVLLRSSVIDAAVKLLDNWPEEFVQTSAACGITRAHFCGASHLHPIWMEQVINSRLAKQNRWVTQVDIRTAVADLRQQGLAVTKAAIRKRLAWQGDIEQHWLN